MINLSKLPLKWNKYTITAYLLGTISLPLLKKLICILLKKRQKKGT